MSGRLLVVGAAGRLGAAIVETFSGWEVVAHTRASLDITDSGAIRRAVDEAAPDVIVNCAAFNHVDAAESQPSDALAVNALAVRRLAQAAESRGATLVHYGTDFVFDGEAAHPYTESDTPSPRSVYAMTKLFGEWFALDAPRGFVLRVESLFGAPDGWTGRGSTLDAIVTALESGTPVRVFTDRTVSPSYVMDVAAATRYLVEAGAPAGLYHCVNSGSATWYAVAEECARLMGVQARLEGITLESYPLQASRPRFCALSNAKLTGAGYPMSSWQDAVGRWLAARRGQIDTLQ
jgi:dTDP-4-dehydrorhamnose reductase